MDWPITWEDVERARAAIAPWVPTTPLRNYPALDRAIGHDVTAWVKHENFNPTCSFKARNGLAALDRLDDEQLGRGVIAASRGNHGQGVAFAARVRDVPAVICVPEGNSPTKNAAMRDLGAEVIEAGVDYDASVSVAHEVAAKRGLHLVHSTNDRGVLAGATTMSVEMLEQNPRLDALIIAVGGGSQAVGALTATRKLAPNVAVYGCQAAEASAIHDSWHAGEPLTRDSADTFADGLATRSTYVATFGALCAGLAGFVVASEEELRSSARVLIESTHSLVEGAAAAGFAGARALGAELAGKQVGIVISGSNIDTDTLRWVLDAPTSLD